MQRKKIEIKFLVSERIACELPALNCLYYEGNACHGQSMGYLTALRLCISVGEIFSCAIPFTVINNYAKSCVLQISTVVVPVYHAELLSS